MTRIPKTIYYCWFGGEKPKKVINCINNWKEKLPNYEIIEINEQNIELFDVKKECKNNLWFKIVWENKLWAYVADYARLKILYERGGIYFDTDITVEKDITELLEKNKLVLGWEDKLSINIANGVMITLPYNSLIKEILDFYNEEIWHSRLFSIPQITTFIIKKYNKLNSAEEITENEDILILPQEYFYPLPIGLSDSKQFVTMNTYTIHWWDGSWTKSNIVYFMRNKHKIETEKLLNKCFKQKILFDNKFLKIEKLFKEISIKFDFYYALNFQYKYYQEKRFLTIIIFGIQIPIWRTI